MSLLQQQCQPAETLTVLNSQQISRYLDQLDHWQLTEANTLSKIFSFDCYAQVMLFVNAVADLAEQQDHHPEMHVTYSQCRVSYQTHIYHALTINDFICASQLDQLADRFSF